MHPIATLTLNPALDLSTSTAHVEPTHKIRCKQPRHDPGGGGINVARVIKILGGEAVAVYTAGGPTGELLRRSLEVMGLAQLVVPISGTTRESFTVNEEATGDQYRFVLPGPSLSEMEQRRCLLDVAALSPAPSFLVVSGGFPPGADEEQLSAEIAELAVGIGARLILDTSQAMRHAPKQGTYLMKPSLSELSRMVGREIASRDDQIAAAKSIVRQGRSEVVVVSLGIDGALLVSDTIAEHFSAPQVPEVSAVGAGDSMVGGIVLALERGWSLTDAVRFGVAAGTATIMTPGTELCRRDDVERLFREMGAAT